MDTKSSLTSRTITKMVFLIKEDRATSTLKGTVAVAMTLTHKVRSKQGLRTVTRSYSSASTKTRAALLWAHKLASRFTRAIHRSCI